jgi:hypothetical protein
MRPVEIDECPICHRRDVEGGHDPHYGAFVICPSHGIQLIEKEKERKKKQSKKRVKRCRCK